MFIFILCFFFVQVDSGKADVERLCITGGSAGGYTTLAALAFKKTFKAGASLYGVSTHFEPLKPAHFVTTAFNLKHMVTVLNR